MKTFIPVFGHALWAMQCRLVDELIPPDLRNCVFGYLDDLIIVSEDFESHVEVLVRLAS